MSCANCATPEGPFTARDKLGPLCRPSTPAEKAAEGYPVGKADPRIVACNKRRRDIDDKNGKDNA